MGNISDKQWILASGRCALLSGAYALFEGKDKTVCVKKLLGYTGVSAIRIIPWYLIWRINGYLKLWSWSEERFPSFSYKGAIKYIKVWCYKVCRTWGSYINPGTINKTQELKYIFYCGNLYFEGINYYFEYPLRISLWLCIIKGYYMRRGRCCRVVVPISPSRPLSAYQTFMPTLMELASATNDQQITVKGVMAMLLSAINCRRRLGKEQSGRKWRFCRYRKIWKRKQYRWKVKFLRKMLDAQYESICRRCAGRGWKILYRGRWCGETVVTAACWPLSSTLAKWCWVLPAGVALGLVSIKCSRICILWHSLYFFCLWMPIKTCEMWVYGVIHYPVTF